MSTRLFVGRLAYATADSALEEHFSQVGKVVSAKVIIDRYSGQGKGFGFVEMASEKEAKEAIEKLNDSELDGRKIVVNEAHPQEDRGNRDNRTPNRW